MMIWPRKKKKKKTDSLPGDPAMTEAFEPLSKLELDDVAAFEFFLFGGISAVVDNLEGRQLVGEGTAVEIFAAIPTVGSIVRSGKTSMQAKVPQWDPHEIAGLSEYRSQFPEATAVATAEPRLLMQRLVPRIQSELSHYAPNRTGQIRSCWVWTMATLSFHTIPPPNRDDLLKVYGAAVQRWEQAIHRA